MLVPDDLVLCLGAIGNASFDERIRAASASGFAGVSMWMSHYDEARAEGLSIPAMRAILDREGVTLAMLEYLTAWADGPSQRAAIVEETSRICAIAEELGSDTVLAVTMAPTIVPADATAGLAIACDVAAPTDSASASNSSPGRVSRTSPPSGPSCATPTAPTPVSSLTPGTGSAPNPTPTGRRCAPSRARR